MSEIPPSLSARAARTRQRILDAAGQCFAARGFSKATIESIAQTAGVSKGLVYHHFRGKDQVLEAVLERTLEEWGDVGALEQTAREKGVIEAIAEMHRTSLAYARDNPVVRALYQLDPIVQQGLGSSAVVRRAIEDLRDTLVRVLRSGVESGELRESLDVERVADVIRILNMGFTDQMMDPQWIDAADARLVEASIEVLFRGIAAEGS